MNLTDLANPAVWQEFRASGFLHLSDVVDSNTVVDVRTEAYRVLGDAERIAKHAYRGKGQSGYTPPGIEGVSGNMADHRARQFWDFHLEDTVARTCSHTTDFVRHMEHLTRQLTVTMNGVFYHMERGLGALASGLHRVMLDGNHGLRVTHYPASAPAPGDVLFPSHRDFSLVTAFVGGAEPGLQIDRSGTWLDVENPLGDLVIIPGGMMRYWTGGPGHPQRIAGLPHRVMRASAERLSLAFFVEPERRTVLPHSNGVTAGEYLDNFVSATRYTA